MNKPIKQFTLPVGVPCQFVVKECWFNAKIFSLSQIQTRFLMSLNINLIQKISLKSETICFLIFFIYCESCIV